MKRLISILLCCTICFSISTTAFAIDHEPSDSYIPIPMENGEITWVLASEFLDSDISPREMDPGCGHTSPPGYRYIGTKIGNTQLELKRADNIAKILDFTSEIPGLKAVSHFLKYSYELSKAYAKLEEDGILLTTYYLFMYQKDGSYWYHYVWYYDENNDGKDDYVLTCKIEEFMA